MHRQSRPSAVHGQQVVQHRRGGSTVCSLAPFLEQVRHPHVRIPEQSCIKPNWQPIAHGIGLFRRTRARRQRDFRVDGNMAKANAGLHRVFKYREKWQKWRGAESVELVSVMPHDCTGLLPLTHFRQGGAIALTGRISQGVDMTPRMTGVFNEFARADRHGWHVAIPLVSNGRKFQTWPLRMQRRNQPVIERKPGR